MKKQNTKPITKTRNMENTKFFYFFFVISSFRAFVIKGFFISKRS